MADRESDDALQGNIAEGISLYKKQKAKLKSLQVRPKTAWPQQPNDCTLE